MKVRKKDTILRTNGFYCFFCLVYGSFVLTLSRSALSCQTVIVVAKFNVNTNQHPEIKARVIGIVS